MLQRERAHAILKCARIITGKWFTDFPAEVLEEGADAGLPGRLATARSCEMNERERRRQIH